jgi:hypothetical protein
MAKTLTLALAATLVLASMAAGADDKKKPAAPPAAGDAEKAMMEAFARMGEVRAEHKQLKYFEGSWSSKASMWMDPKAPPQESKGDATIEAIYEGRYFSMKQTGDMGGQPFQGQGLWGFDNLRGKFFTTWIDSMSTGFWLSYGSYDAAKKTYTYHGDMPDPMQPSKTTKVRQVVHVVDDNHYTFEWHEMHDGKEAKTMQIDYTRK